MISLNLLNSVAEIFVIKVQGFEPDISSARDEGFTIAPATHIHKTGPLN